MNKIKAAQYSFLIICICTIYNEAAAQTNTPSFPTGITTISGARYDSVKINQIFTNRLTIIYARPSGVMDMASINFDDLPPAWEKFCKSYKEKTTPKKTVYDFDKIIANSGVVYSNVNVSRVEQDGLTVSYTSDGAFKIRKLDFDEIPESFQIRYGFDPKDLPAYRQKKLLWEQGNKEYQARYNEALKTVRLQMKTEKAAEDRQKYEDGLKLQQLFAQERIASAQERQASALELQSFQQRMDAIDQDYQNRKMVRKLDDIDWQLTTWDLMNHRHY